MGKVKKQAPDGGAIAAWRQGAQDLYKNLFVAQLASRTGELRFADAPRKLAPGAVMAIRGKGFEPAVVLVANEAAVQLAELTDSLAGVAMTTNVVDAPARRAAKLLRGFGSRDIAKLLSALEEVELLADQLDARFYPQEPTDPSQLGVAAERILRRLADSDGPVARKVLLGVMPKSRQRDSHEASEDGLVANFKRTMAELKELRWVTNPKRGKYLITSTGLAALNKR